MKFLVETSARHVHLTEETFKVLFGEDATLTVKKELSQPGQYACEERVTVVGPKKELAGVSILGPYRKADQVEISLTDARSIGLPGVVRESGDLANTPGCTLIGPKGQVTISEGVIVAKRHIHATTKDAADLNVTNGQVVKVKLETEGRSLIFDDVVVRVSDTYALAMHIDTDESNAAGCGRVQYGEIVE
jgi:putative phosphotransacetylase